MSATKITSSPITITDATFESQVLQSTVPVLLDFWASWCVPCNLMKRSVEKAAATLEGEALVGLVNVDEMPELVSRFDVQATPTFILVKNGQVLVRFSGMATAGSLVSRVRSSTM